MSERTALFLRRIVVFKSGKAVFDEPFHLGLNIIHGDNGSGKSTIADFIFFVLGGDLKEWKRHAAICDDVIAEIFAGGAILTLRRQISTDPMKPMDIFFGSYTDAIASAASGWRRFEYKRGDKGLSFSQALFDAIGIPEAPGDGGSNITMHQILRLLYSDQMTPVQRIFRAEPFDSWDTRQTVGDLVCAIGGYDLLDMRLRLRELEKTNSEITREYRSLVTVAARYGEDIRPEHLEAEILKQNDKRIKLRTSLDEYVQGNDTSKAETKEANLHRKKATTDIVSLKKQLSELEERVHTLQFEIEDSASFIRYLNDTLAAFEDAASTYKMLGQVQFEYCPACFSSLANSEAEHVCHLCGEAFEDAEKESRVLALKLDFQQQIRESLALQLQREEALKKLKSEQASLSRIYKRESENYNTLMRSPLSARDEKIGELNRQIGFIDSTLETLSKRLEIAQQIVALSDQRKNLRKEISDLQEAIEAMLRNQKARRQVSSTEIAKWTLKFLREDLSDQNDFESLDAFQFSFGDDWMAINGERNVSRSASGMVILKNSFHVALLFAALKDKLFNLPKFMLLDNIEDKGMVQKRSWNFQNVVAKYSDATKVPHQIIMTTSMFSPELEKRSSDFVIGRKYTKQNKTLNFNLPQ